MVKFLFFNALLLACCGYAFLRGGAPERIGAAIFAIGTGLTVVAASSPATRFASLEVGILIVDGAALVGFLILALFAERYWPSWLTALQAIGTAGHAIKLADPEGFPWAYAFALAFWSYPMLLLIALGTFRHQRRVAKFGVDRSWSSFSAPWARRRETGPTA
ncbi:MAG TPA: hypothetical protein VGW40_04615 [Allosphingosinicella sp.]|nr:hypothetical protein [Allosphingosinicella sp.]